MRRTNAEQLETFVNYMDKIPNPKRHKKYYEFWQELTNVLNKQGPPIRDSNAWQRVHTFIFTHTFFIIF